MNASTAAPRADHPKLTAALATLASADLGSPCGQPPPPLLEKAIREFNEGEFFEQHETIETLWRAEPGAVRHLYEGILLVGVGLYHTLEKHNFYGACVKLDHGIRLLSVCPVTCHGLDVARLVEDARRARRHLVRLGPDGIARFRRDRVPRIHRVQAVA
ncbi:MAG: DUF309 domain-containing protein [Chloroflexi bacterium]|nr:DUF309 domain-containing protein [Chloroflexota bacterium]